MNEIRPGTLPLLSIVVPCYNEEEVLPETVKRLTNVLDNLIGERLISGASRVLFVDDGSRDETWNLIEVFNMTNKYVTGLKLARNAGHQNALWAGLMKARKQSDIVISIDADLQDDVDAIREMVLRFHEGYEVVYGVRKSRGTDTFFKRFTAEGFYKLMQKMGANIVFNHADYRLMSRRALDNLARFEEVNLFLRGIVPMVGFKSTSVYYDRHERFAGESKYPLKKMLMFAFDGITSLSVTPIRLVTLTGFILFVVSIAAGIYAIVDKLVGNPVSGWASLMVSVWFIGGIQLISLGLIGEYIGKIYKETKRRPRYIVETELEPQTVDREDPRAISTP
ncbi:glycosyltransferase family 2 protein [Effusibacillus lacus]|uniref:Glycosyltransferase n=1 Tax=Effusibacillus lacus TaxID=1348429 RepID=A0A292YU54_9BACL|nr:glycosyltransferase family 2 protein [Effusibacillus lacus]TCS73764.1 glycosyltransferase involved in cell wall biosynthesis [Effusibacillus lacus]GAX92025.1 glycosyltransferase [Effusibacillus lacus]